MTPVWKRLEIMHKPGMPTRNWSLLTWRISVILPRILTKEAWKVSALSGSSNESTSLLSSSDDGWANLTETHPHEKDSKFLPLGTASLVQKHHMKTQNPSTEHCHACLESIGCGDWQLAKPGEWECKLCQSVTPQSPRLCVYLQL